MSATAPFQFALQARAGTEALAHVLQCVTDRDPETVVVSLDGIGAFDHVKRAAFLRKLRNTPSLQHLVPFARMLCSTESRFFWADSESRTHAIRQGEGGEQSDPLTPAFYAVAQHDALEAARGELLPSEHILSFLDDLYVVTTKARAAAAFRVVAEEVERRAGVRSHLGKLKMVPRRGRRAARGGRLGTRSMDCR